MTRRETWAAIAAFAWGAAALSYLTSEAAAALAFRPAYSYARNYISDLGLPTCGVVFEGRVVCSPLHDLLNADFLLQGALFAAAALAATRMLAHPSRHALVAAAIANAVGIALVGLFPEDTGVVRLHALGALLSIVFGNVTVLVSAFAFGELRLPRLHRPASLALPSVAAVAFSMLIAARIDGRSIGLPDGAWERASVYTITIWEIVTAICLLAWASRRRQDVDDFG